MSLWINLQEQKRAEDTPKPNQLWKRGVTEAAHSGSNWWDAGELQVGSTPQYWRSLSTCVTARPQEGPTWHRLLPILMWLLTVYKVPMTCVEGLRGKINKYLWRWLGIPPSFTAAGLYIRSGQLQLPLSSVVEEFKVTKCSVVMTYRDSQDEQVRHAGIITRSGRQWAADLSVAQAESMLKLCDVIGALYAQGDRVLEPPISNSGGWQEPVKEPWIKRMYRTWKRKDED